jgi:hypothetical protein
LKTPVSPRPPYNSAFPILPSPALLSFRRAPDPLGPLDILMLLVFPFQ